MKIIPSTGRYLVVPHYVQKEVNGLIESGAKKTSISKIIACGESITNSPLNLKVADYVITLEYAGTVVELEDGTIGRVVTIDEIVAKVEY